MAHDPVGRERRRLEIEAIDREARIKAHREQTRKQDGILEQSGLFEELQTIVEHDVSYLRGHELEKETVDELFVLLQKMAELTSPDFALETLVQKAGTIIYSRANSDDIADFARASAKERLTRAIAFRAFAGFMEMKPQKEETDTAEIAKGVAADTKGQLPS